jgi:hypothetical protein
MGESTGESKALKRVLLWVVLLLLIVGPPLIVIFFLGAF